MKKHIYVLLIIALLIPKQSKAQDGAAAAGALIGAPLWTWLKTKMPWSN